ncbi:MAG TPA: penicillin-binding transpeptidase domain-containing protein [Actinoplanes sp.]|nr:penicillin-binding transpeptidase domain-containing protein [Actinoplanes sp.]
MNRPIRRVALAMLVLFGLLIANVNYVQVFQGTSLRTDPGNTRVLLDEYERQRGTLVVDGRAVAQSDPTDDKLKYLRRYPGKGTYAPVTGFYSLIYGSTGMEQAENDFLAGSDNRLFTQRLSALLTGRDPRGGNIVLTINRRAQEAAVKGLGDRRGAVVALDPRTGAILAMVSGPSYDPNPISSHDPARIRAEYTRLANDPADPLLNRGINQRYPPGSTFKVITAAAALENGRTPETLVDCPPQYVPPQTTRPITNFGRESCSAPKVTLQQALTQSYNTAFAKLGVELGAGELRRLATAFGIDGKPFTVPLRVSASAVGDLPDPPAVAQSAIGQRDVALTPLQGAMIAAAVANNGVLMKPNLIRELQGPDLSVLDEPEPEQLTTAVSPDVAGQLSQMMRSVVDNGTGRAARIEGVPVAGKTGTAQTAPGRPPHAWFIGFASSGDRQVAVSVIIENGGNSGSETTGGEAAAPVAKDVMEAVLGVGGG